MRVSLIFNRKGKPNKNGLALIQLRAYQGGQNKFYSTNIYLLPRQWKNDKVVDHPNAKELNSTLKSLIATLEEFIIQQNILGYQVSFQSIEKFLKYNDLQCFHSFCAQELKEDNGLAPGTKKHHNVTLNYLKEKFTTLSFSDLSYTTVHDFNNFLLGKGLNANTIHGHHKRVKKYINLAIKKEMLVATADPYKHFKVKKVETKRDVLTIDELNRLEALELPTIKKHLEIVRDMFLFGCYTGLRFSDIAGLKRTDLHINFDQVILKLIAQKTGKPLDLPLHVLHDGKPARLIARYAQKDYRKIDLFPGITACKKGRAKTVQ